MKKEKKKRAAASPRSRAGLPSRSSTRPDQPAKPRAASTCPEPAFKPR
jgi:hypothetical protein